MKANKFLVALLLTVNVNHIQAQPAAKENTMNTSTRLIQYEVKPAQLAAFKKAVAAYVLHSLRLESNILSEAYYEEEKPSVIWIIERCITCHFHLYSP